MSLSRRDILDEALRILDRYGLADLSMRRIAGALEVRPGALYWHFADKQTLLAALAMEVLAGTPDPHGDLREAVASWADALRERLLAHRDGAELVASAVAMGLVADSPIQRLAAYLAAQGVDAPEDAAGAVVHLVLGHTVHEQTRSQLRELGVVAEGPGPDSDRPLRRGIAMMVRAMERR